MNAELLQNLSSKLSSVNDPDIPPWALLIIECFKGLISVIHEFSIKEDEVSTLRNKNNMLQNEINNLKLRTDDNEQRSRNSCLLIHGIDEKPKEDTDIIIMEVIEKELGIKLNDDDIQRSHRLGPVNNSRNTRSNTVKPRPIICRFLKFTTRQKIYFSKRKLKGKKLTITENLTSTRYKLYQAALKKFGRRGVWSNEGRIMTKVNDKVTVIKTLDELDKYEDFTEELDIP